jgi:uncharacterized membrane protein/uncharacterized protein YhjY with autotransporter beta-barrel domain
MTRTSSILLGATALAMFAAPQLASAQTTRASVVFLPGVSLTGAPPQCGTMGGNTPNTSAIGISSDGSVVAGDSTYSNCVVLWRNGIPELQPGNFVGLPSYGNSPGRLTSLSGNGRVLVGFGAEQPVDGSLLTYSNGRVAYWTAGADTRYLPAIETLTAAQFNASLATRLPRLAGSTFQAVSEVRRFAYGPAFVNNDGSYFAVSSAYSGDFRVTGQFAVRDQFDGRVFRWNPTNGYQELPNFGDATAMAATGIDGSGNRIIGIAQRVFGILSDGSSDVQSSAFLWDAEGGLVRLPDLATSFTNVSIRTFTGASGISRDGSTIIGHSRSADGLFHPVFWQGGKIFDLGFLPGRTPTSPIFNDTRINPNIYIPQAASAGGRVIVGFVGGYSLEGGYPPDRAWRWSAASGMQDLNQIATNAGLNLNGFTLYEANGISDDGQFISGNASDSEQRQFFGYVLQLAQVTQSRLIVTLRLPSVTQTSVVNQTFSTQVDALLNGRSVFTRTVTDPITATSGVTALADARAALQVGSGLRRVVIGAPTLISNITTVTGTTNNTIDVASGTTTTTASVNTFGPATVATGNLGNCATPAANNVNPTGCSLPGTPVTVDTGILNTNVFTNTINSVTPTITQTVNQLVSARWQVSATAGNQFGTVHALVGPATFERGDQFVGQLTAGRSRRNVASPDHAEVSLFGGYSGGRSRIDADPSIPVAATRGSHEAFTIGAERRVNQHLAVGAAFDHGTSDIKVQDPQYGERLELTQTQVGAFGTLSTGRASVSGAVSYGFGDVETTLATPTGPARASRDARSWTLGVEGAYDLPLGSSATLALIGGARTTRADLQSFTEAGGSSPLRGLDSTVDRTRLYAGFDLGGQLNAGTAQIEPSVYVRAARDQGDRNGVANVVFANAPGGPTLSAVGPNVGGTVFEYGAALSARVSTNTRLTLGYDATTRDNATSSAARLELSMVW